MLFICLPFVCHTNKQSLYAIHVLWYKDSNVLGVIFNLFIALENKHLLVWMMSQIINYLFKFNYFFWNICQYLWITLQGCNLTLTNHIVRNFCQFLCRIWCFFGVICFLSPFQNWPHKAIYFGWRKFIKMLFKFSTHSATIFPWSLQIWPSSKETAMKVKYKIKLQPF